jgi:hypothetical protein
MFRYMDVATTSQTWSLQRTIGAIHGKQVSGRVDVARPDRGLGELQFRGRRVLGELFCLQREIASAEDHSEEPLSNGGWPLKVADSYVRGDDLVVSYHPAENWPYSPQVYWRAAALSHEKVIASLSLWISVQTHLLDTYPLISLSSHLATTELLLVANGTAGSDSKVIACDCSIELESGTCCLLRRLADADLSYAEYMPASDFQALRIRTGSRGEWQVEWRLFADFLEKGVIRRARMHGVFLPRQDDLEIAVSCCEAIEREALPLTA